MIGQEKDLFVEGALYPPPPPLPPPPLCHRELASSACSALSPRTAQREGAAHPAPGTVSASSHSTPSETSASLKLFLYDTLSKQYLVLYTSFLRMLY